MSLAALGTLLTAAYLLVVVRRVCMGSAPQTTHEARDAPETSEAGKAHETHEIHGIPDIRNIQDVQGYELATWSPLVALTVLAGLWPAALLGLSDPAVQKLLAGGKA